MMSQQQAQADEIIRRYADLLRQNGCPVSRVPRVEVRTLPTLISYSGGLLPVLDRFGSETMANRFAVAFWRTQAGSGMQLDRIGRAAKCIYHSLPNPVPAGDDPVRYFNSNYDRIGSIPTVYGWYQLKMTADAYDARASLDFGSMVRDALSAPHLMAQALKRACHKSSAKKGGIGYTASV